MHDYDELSNPRQHLDLPSCEQNAKITDLLSGAYVVVLLEGEGWVNYWHQIYIFN